MKHPYLWLLLLASAAPAAAQRPTAEAARPAVSFWPLDAQTGTVAFVAPTRQPTAPALRQAEHARAWLTSTCGKAWSELQTAADSTQLYQGRLQGIHPGVVLNFALRVNRQPAGWQYRLFACQVSSPTNAGITHWLPLHRLLKDSDFRPDVRSFQQQLQRALPGL
jgi:hypothetical protein